MLPFSGSSRWVLSAIVVQEGVYITWFKAAGANSLTVEPPWVETTAISSSAWFGDLAL